MGSDEATPSQRRHVREHAGQAEPMTLAEISLKAECIEADPMTEAASTAAKVPRRRWLEGVTGDAAGHHLVASNRARRTRISMLCEDRVGLRPRMRGGREPLSSEGWFAQTDSPGLRLRRWGEVDRVDIQPVRADWLNELATAMSIAPWRCRISMGEEEVVLSFHRLSSTATLRTGQRSRNRSPLGN